MSKPDSLAGGEALRLSELIAPAPSGIASRVLAKATGGSVSLFAFDEGKGLSQHTAPFDALLLVLDGSLSVTIGENRVNAEPGTIIRLPANIPHAVDATAASRMLLIMLRETGASTQL
jgi:quercetin dioxygenase-like cupin family protein